MPHPPQFESPGATVEVAGFERLERAWNDWRPGQTFPHWADLLPPGDLPCDLDHASYLVQVDVEYRARAGLPALLAEPYFLHPRLRLDDARQAELIRWEYHQRWKHGQRVRRQDYLAAFPRLAAALADLRPRWTCPTCRRLADADEDTPPSDLRCENCGTAFPCTVPIPPPPHPEADARPNTSATFDPRSYTLLEQLGAGGMGEVYRCLDPGLGRDLAVKVLRAELSGNTEAEARFLREARITGALEHPGIVPVHNLGRLPDGRLYLTMKLVRGRTLDHILADRPEPRPEPLLGHFEKVCQALAYAHSRGVVHRDLKPQNVMIGEFGEVQVMDWGLAKNRKDEGESGSCSPSSFLLPPSSFDQVTRSGLVMGTPAYMPPEQARGLGHQADERADVFSLGAILCVILTGRPPFADPDWQDALAQARRGDLSGAWDRLTTCGADEELLTLCRECLSANPAGRPTDAGVVARRLAGYQDGVRDRLRQAELERSQTRVREQERRKRRRLAGALLALLVVGLAVGLWAVTREQRRTAAALTEAEGNLALARRAIDETFNTAVEDPLFQQPRMEQVRRRLLEKTLPFYARFRDRRPDDPSVRREEALQLYRVAFIEDDLGRPGPARQCYDRALALQRQLVRDHPEVLLYQRDLAFTHNDLAVLLSRQKKFEEALSEAGRAEKLRRGLVAAAPGVPEHQNALATTLNVRAVQLMALERHAQAEQEYRRACEIGEALVKAHPAVLDYQTELARPYLNLGALLAAQGRQEESAQALRRARDLRHRLVEARPANTVYRSSLARVLSALGDTLDSLGRTEEAVKEMRQAHQIQLAVARANPDLPAYQAELGRITYNLGITLARLEKHEEAREVYARSRDQWLELMGAFPDQPEHRKQLADTRTNLGGLSYEMNRPKEAEAEYRQARELLAPLLKANPDNPEYAVSLARASGNLGQVLRRLKRPRDAMPLLDEGVTLLLRMHDRAPVARHAHTLLFFALPQRAATLQLLGRTAEADADWDRLLRLCTPEERLGVRVTRAKFRAGYCDHHRAAEEADELGRAPGLTGANLYDLACVFALNARCAGQEASRPLPERERTAERYAQKAVALLRRAAAAGRFRSRAQMAELTADTDLASLRDRDDFRALLTELGQQASDQ